MKNIHHRMPVILDEDEEDKYLDPESQDIEKLYKILVSSYPSEKMKAYPVSRAVNSPKNNSKDLLKEEKEQEFNYGLLGKNL
jgi:putative SOS response-associated peptidase YedK